MNGQGDSFESKLRTLLNLPAAPAIDELPEPGRSYLTYAMGTVARGESTLGSLRPHLKPGFRYLDVGCAYGGFLVAASRLGAGAVCGFDMDSRLTEIAAELLKSHGVSGQVLTGDVTDAAFTRTLGQFDLITCNDVIEHVLDLPACIDSISRLLAPGGLALFAVPNPRSAQLIRSDPHFQLFGIVLLRRELAEDYAVEVTRWPKYDVGDYYPYRHFESVLEARGLKPSLLNELPAADLGPRLGELARDFKALAVEARERNLPAIGLRLRLQVRAETLKVCLAFQRDFLAFRALRRARLTDEAQRFARGMLRDYDWPTWNVLAHKRA